MSKQLKRAADTRYREQWIFPGYADPPDRPADEVDADVLRATTDVAGELPREVMKALRSSAAAITRPCRADTAWNGFKDYTLRQRAWAHVREENEFIAGLVMDGVERGFRLAVERYAKQLRNVPELATWRRKRAQGGTKGRASQTAAKLRRAPQAQAMLSEGHDVPEIAKRLGCSISTVYRALNTAATSQTKVARTRHNR